MSSTRLIAVVCAAQVLAQIGAYAVPALLPTFIAEWRLTNTEAGWITGIFYGGYTLSVPVLVTLTDRMDPKRIYLAAVAMTTLAHLGYAVLADGFWSAFLFRTLAGIGWAGTYMPGLKALSDLVEGPRQSRAVAAHAASVGISGAASFIIAGTVAVWLDWRWAIALGGVGAALAFFVMLAKLPAREPLRRADHETALLDFRPVFRNRSAMAYSLSYLVHTWEMNALRGWVVTFLAFTAAQTGDDASVITPPAIATALGLIGVWASVSGNELSIRFGRRRLIFTAMLASMAMALIIGFSSGVSYLLAAGLCLIYGALIWGDSSSLTAGTVGSARPGQRGATMAVHSALGYGGGFMGPLVIGLILDLAGGESVLGWGIAFAHVAVVMLFGVLALKFLRPAGLAGDRPGT
jgi:MFS family permease